LLAASVLTSETDPVSSKEFLKRELEADPYVIKVSVGQHTPIATIQWLWKLKSPVKSNILFGATISHQNASMNGRWMPPAVLVSTFGNGLIAYDFVRALQMPIQTRLPVEAVFGDQRSPHR
jgi:hypothetical protein